MDLALSWRNIWRNPRRTAVILTAVVIGLAAMLFLAAFARGSTNSMVENAVDVFVGHILIQNAAFREDPDIANRISDPDALIRAVRKALPPDVRNEARIAARVNLEGVASTARKSAGVMIVGADRQAEAGVSFIGDAPMKGRWFGPDNPRGAVVGEALLDELDLAVGRKLILMSQGADGEMKSAAFRITGSFRSSSAGVEKTTVLISLETARNMLALDQDVTEISITLPGNDLFATDFSRYAEAIRKQAAADPALSGEDLNILTWREVLASISAYLELFDRIMLIWYLAIFIAMGFGITNTVLMAVYERMREFGLLKALGMRPFNIFNMVMQETGCLLFCGLLLGNAVGFLILQYMAGTGIDLTAFASSTEAWGIDRVIYPALIARDIFSANLIVLILGLAAGIYPAVKAARFVPVEAMRHI